MTRRDRFSLIAFFALLITLIPLPAWVDHNNPAPDYNVQLPLPPAYEGN